MSAINWVFFCLISSAVIFAGFTGTMDPVKVASFEAAKASVELALKLIGVMALWLGLVRILEAGGLMRALARGIKPVMRRLFPDVPAEHPAMGTMLLNISANMLGLGNAATPFGLKAMVELNKLNPFPGTATNAMCLFLTINTSSVTILPLGAIAIRAAAGSGEPAAILIPSMLATGVSTLVGVSLALILARSDRRYLEAARKEVGAADDEEFNEEDEDEFKELKSEPSVARRMVAGLVWTMILLAFGYGLIRSDSPTVFLKQEFLNDWLIPLLILAMLNYGLGKGVHIYEAVCDGAKQGFQLAIKIIPFLVAILVAIAMFRASGLEQLITAGLQPITSIFGLPSETLSVALLRPLSGSGSFAAMSALVERAPDSYAAFVASTMQGSTETTFYVLAVYFGSVGITRVRHALIAALSADIAGIIASGLICSWFWN